jgi:dolichol kinase
MIKDTDVIMDPLKKEIFRKMFHSLILFYALGYLLLGRQGSLVTFSILLVVITVFESARILSPRFNEKLMVHFKTIYREQEISHFSGIFWTLLGILLTIALVPDPKIVIWAIVTLALGDSAAALVGIRFGGRKFFGKTVAGSLAFFSTAFVIGLYFFSPWTALWGALFATVIEFLPLPFGDNFWMPFLSSVFLYRIAG